MKAMLIAVLSALLLMACNETTPNVAPVVSGEFITPGTSRLTLVPQQLAGCVEWLKDEQRTWGKLRGTPPSPVQVLALTHSDGARSYIEFYTGKPGWRGRLLLKSYDKDGHLQFTGVDDISDQEMARLTIFLPEQ
ncbi:MAG TPA: hypothetical protein VN066_01910 [Rhodocyclaceae bacterium]|jgi:hypothetical protein|nr:hypothetical protein [Rhodocyclaceae bacterium]